MTTHIAPSDPLEYEESVRDKRRREALAKLVQPVQIELQTLEMSNESENAHNLLEVVNRGTFKLLIMGEFKTGKSTFINALLRQKVLPSYATPTTAIINEVKYGDTPQALLHFHAEGKKPMLIPVNELEKYVVINENAEQQKKNKEEFSHVELFWNLDLCRNRVEIIDSPGLNEDESREQVTNDYLPKVDGIIFVMMASHFWSVSEQASIELLEKYGHNEVFFVLNQFDLLDTDADREKVRQRANINLQPKTKRKNAIHFVSARDALRGYLSNNQHQIDSSGFPQLEDVLRTFLWDERSRVKIRRAAQELQLTILRAQAVIPDKRQLLTIPLEDLQKRYQEAQERFRQVELDKSEMIRRYERFRENTKELVRGKVNEFFFNTENKIESWAKEYPLKVKLNLDVRGQINDGVQAIAEDLNSKLEAELETWVQTMLIPFVAGRLDDIKRDLERMAETFEANLRRAKLQLGIHLETDELGVGQEGPRNALERILAAAGGFFVAGLAGAGIGAVFGWRELLKSITPQLMVGMAAMIIGLPLLPVMIIAAIIQGGFTAFNLLNRIKEETAKTYRYKLQEIASAQADKIAQQIDSQLSEIQVQIERGIQAQIDSVKEQAQTALATQQKGKAEVDAKLEAIGKTEQHLREISVELIEFIKRLDQPDEGVFSDDRK